MKENMNCQTAPSQRRFFFTPAPNTLILTLLIIAGALMQRLVSQAAGSTVALGVAVRHPELARKVAILGSTARSPKDTYERQFYQEYQSLSADFAPPELKNPYDKTSPDPTRWPILVQKIKEMGPAFKGYSDKELKEIKAQVLIMIGDREGVRPEHAVEMYRVIPNAQLAIFPRGDHFMIFQSPDKVLATLVPFLDAALPNAK
jgi:pimeloyl-ACP methyl ester carboxylesterase